MGEQPLAADAIADELRLIRKNVPGVRGSIAATADGLLVAHDMHGIEPTQIAALVAATHAVALRASLSTQCGQLREVITRGSDGYLAVYAAGPSAIVAVIGVSDMNVAMLNFQARKMIERIAEHSAGLSRRSRRGPGTKPPDAAPGPDAAGAHNAARSQDAAHGLDAAGSPDSVQGQEAGSQDAARGMDAAGSPGEDSRAGDESLPGRQV